MMKTEVLTPSDEAVERAAKLIIDGETVAFPTETVYGLGGNALNPDAVRRIFEAKGRPNDNPLIAHIQSVDELFPLISVEPSELAFRMMEAFWPGPLTMIFPKSDIVPKETTGGLDTVAVRFPVHPVAQKLIKFSGVPIAAPSANRSGRPSPTTAAHVFEDMEGRIPMILDGGACDVGVESTVVDMTGNKPRILRPGGITPEMIERIAGSAEVDDAVMRPLTEGEKPRSPGMKYRHYAPKGDLTLFHGNDEQVISAMRKAYDEAAELGKRPLILALDGHISAFGNRKTLSLGKDASEMAHKLFAILRECDELNADVMFAEAIERDGVGLAVMNRLGRAAAFHIVEV